MADGHTFSEARTASRKRIVDAFAEHCHTVDFFTRITLRARHDDRGSVFIANVDGLKPDGEVVEFGHHSDAYRLHLVEPKDCAVLLRFSQDLAEAPVATTLHAFLAENEFDAEERVLITTRVLAGGLYCGGGGAAQEWFLFRADVPAERFGAADGSKFFQAAA